MTDQELRSAEQIARIARDLADASNQRAQAKDHPIRTAAILVGTSAGAGAGVLTICLTVLKTFGVIH